MDMIFNNVTFNLKDGCNFYFILNFFSGFDNVFCDYIRASKDNFDDITVLNFDNILVNFNDDLEKFFLSLLQKDLFSQKFENKKLVIINYFQIHSLANNNSVVNIMKSQFINRVKIIFIQNVDSIHCVKELLNNQLKYLDCKKMVYEVTCFDDYINNILCYFSEKYNKVLVNMKDIKESLIPKFINNRGLVLHNDLENVFKYYIDDIKALSSHDFSSVMNMNENIMTNQLCELFFLGSFRELCKKIYYFDQENILIFIKSMIDKVDVMIGVKIYGESVFKYTRKMYSIIDIRKYLDKFNIKDLKYIASCLKKLEIDVKSGYIDNFNSLSYFCFHFFIKRHKK